MIRMKQRPMIRKIIAALRFRVVQLAKPPPVPELDFINITGNHGQFREKLRQLGQFEAADNIRKNALHVGLRWMQLSHNHLEDASFSLQSRRDRSTFSRSYYAVYNASKAVRYIVSGSVSLKGDDHHKASDLPDDFPQVSRWAELVPKIYEHRLHADYDNWTATSSELTISPQQAYDLAKEFVDHSTSYLHAKFGI